MPIFLNPKYPGPERRPGLNWPRLQSDSFDSTGGASLRIGLINNMADAAMGPTEQQFLTLLDAAAGDLLVHVTLYALPEVERKSSGKRRVDSFYFGIDQLWDQPPELAPDGLIVTGREPTTSDLREEAYWPSFLRVVQWTKERRRSAVWSCLAAHAAVLAIDGIERVRCPHKYFGIFNCERTTPHPLLAGAPDDLSLPHSRWNGVSAESLHAKGYHVLTRTRDGGVDTFIKQDAGLNVFFQGHPEYEARTLMGEYRRDVGRYIRGEAEIYPSLPQNCFEKETEHSLREIESKVKASREEKYLREITTVLTGVRVRNTWRESAIVIQRNWLEHLCMNKRQGSFQC